MRVHAGDIGCDYAYVGDTNPAKLRYHRVRFVHRYITRGASPKRLLPAERDWLLDNGFGIRLVWETSITAILGGAVQGALDGREAAKQATLLGFPTNLPIEAAVDTDVFSANVTLCRAYLNAFYANCGPYPEGLYGDEDAWNAVAGHDPFWVIPNAWGWSPRDHAKPNPNVDIRQGPENKLLGWDYPNVALRDFDAWSRDAPPTPDIPPPPREDEIVITIIENRDQYDASFIGEATAAGAIFRVIWVDGRNPRSVVALEAHRQNGATVKPFAVSQFATFWTNAVPVGDNKHAWKLDDFAGLG